ncbi:MAG: hypothetical protein ACNYPE_07075 [Candidatus Azotimanducaceae bacterium WSBS_2022_MAG_OTU7]
MRLLFGFLRGVNNSIRLNKEQVTGNKIVRSPIWLSASVLTPASGLQNNPFEDTFSDAHARVSSALRATVFFCRRSRQLPAASLATAMLGSANNAIIGSLVRVITHRVHEKPDYLH